MKRHDWVRFQDMGCGAAPPSFPLACGLLGSPASRLTLLVGHCSMHVPISPCVFSPPRLLPHLEGHVADYQSCWDVLMLAYRVNLARKLAREAASATSASRRVELMTSTLREALSVQRRTFGPDAAVGSHLSGYLDHKEHLHPRTLP